MGVDAMTHVHRVTRRRCRHRWPGRRVPAFAHTDGGQTRITIAHVGDQRFGREEAESQNHDKGDESSAKADGAMIHRAEKRGGVRLDRRMIAGY